MTQTIRGAPRPGRLLPLVLLALGACMAGCSDDDDGGGATPPASTAGTGGSGGSGGGAGKGGSNPGGAGGTSGGNGGTSSGGAGQGGSGLSLSVKAVGGSDTAKLPFDATPDPDGTAVYFTAVGVEGNGVYKVTLADGAQSTLFEGEPLANPVSIAISDDGNTLFLADPAAEDASGDEGQIFSVPTGGGAPTALAGVGGRSPRGLDVRGDKVYFSGRTKGIAGVYTTPTAGGSATALLEGAPLVDPVGLVANKGGDVFVLDAATPGGATLFKISGGQATALAEGLQVGFPAGVALNLDESAVMVSAINPDTGNDLVWVINATSGDKSMFDDTIGQFQEAAGLHRAKNKEMFAWADSKANNTGKVFVLQK